MKNLKAAAVIMSIGSLMAAATLVEAQHRVPAVGAGHLISGIPPMQSETAKQVSVAKYVQIAQSAPPKATTSPPPSTPSTPTKMPPPGHEHKAEGTASESTAVNPAGDFQPVIHARSVNVSTCMDKIVTQSNEIIDRPHTAISRWVQTAPNEHVFESIIGLTNPSKIAPSAVAVIMAAPLNGSRCEGETVQIYPTAQPCGTVQASLVRSGRTIGAVQSMPVIDTDDGARIVLLPNGGSGCVLVRMRTS